MNEGGRSRRVLLSTNPSRGGEGADSTSLALSLAALGSVSQHEACHVAGRGEGFVEQRGTREGEEVLLELLSRFHPLQRRDRARGDAFVLDWGCPGIVAIIQGSCLFCVVAFAARRFWMWARAQGRVGQDDPPFPRTLSLSVPLSPYAVQFSAP